MNIKKEISQINKQTDFIKEVTESLKEYDKEHLAKNDLVEVYENTETGETVPIEDSFKYALDKLGLTFKIKEDNLKDQLEFMTVIIDWYFSNKWIHSTEEEK